jgi:hypothetical protein
MFSSRTAVCVPPFLPSQSWGASSPFALAIASKAAYDVQPQSSALLR